jgi:N-acetylglucosamine-6-phosphate deacetylase
MGESFVESNLMRTLIQGGRLLTPQQTLDHHVLVIEDGRIRAVEPEGQVSTSPGEDSRVIDSEGMLVAPGMIDAHVHGAVGCDTMDATPEALGKIGAFFLRQGVTSYLPTTITNSPESTWRAIDNVTQYRREAEGAVPLGLHLEGPYLGYKNRGAQPAEWLRNPDPAEYQAWFETDFIRLVTLAPEIPGALDLIRTGVPLGVRFSAGHTEANFEQMRLAADAGLTQATHTFNGMTGLHHREPGTVGAILTDDRIYAEVIADGIHLHPAVLGLVFRAKGPERTILVTDAMRATGMVDGEYDLGGQIVTVREGVARTAAGGLAGSTLTMASAIKNAQRVGREIGLTLNEVLAMATATPAQALGLEGRKGSLRPGGDADIILMDGELNIQHVLVGGKLIW